MIVKPATSPDSLPGATPHELRKRYLIESLLTPGELQTAYAFEDRLVVGGAVPTTKSLALEPGGPVNATSFLSRREIGILHAGGGPAVVKADGIPYDLTVRDMLYLGSGEREVEFASTQPDDPARLYFASAVAHRSCPDRKIARDEVEPIGLGSAEGSSRRHLYRVIDPARVETASLLMGYTELVAGDTWNTMPPHLHDRRAEIYFYFDLPDDQRVFHLMGAPDQTRHIVVANEQAVISPPWSIHAGVGTCAYTFCWAVAGENTAYGDLDPVAVADLC